MRDLEEQPPLLLLLVVCNISSISINDKTFFFINLPIAMSWTAVMLLVSAKCFGTRKSNVTIRTVTVNDNWLLWRLSDNLLSAHLTRSFISIRSGGTWRGRSLMHSHVPVERNFLISTVRALSARVLLACFYRLRRRLATVRFGSRFSILVSIFSMWAVVGLMSFKSW